MRTPVVKVIFLFFAFILNDTALAQDTAAEEKICNEIGFKRKTEAFGNCVLELVGRKGSQSVTADSSDPDDATCLKYGFKRGTSEFAQCKLQIDQAKQDTQRHQAQYAAQQKRYETELNEYKRRKREAESMALLGMSLGILAGSGNQGSGVGAAPTPPPIPSNEFRRYSLPNGKIMQCNTFGSNTQCF
jgi:hypothetical protein